MEISCPYRGLSSFEEGDAKDFYGREAAISALVKHLGAALPTGGITALVGASGAGKSSLVHAGLIPALKNNGLPGSASWPILVMAPGEQPLAQLRDRVPDLVDALQPTEAPARPHREAEGEDEDDRLTPIPGPRSAGRLEDRVQAAVRDFAHRTGGPTARLVLILDQAEELFTLCEDPQERERFIAVLHAAATADTAASEPGTDTPALVLFSRHCQVVGGRERCRG